MEDKPNQSLNPAPAPEAEKITSRRSRKDQEGRDYQCGCGKRYLSYPALYTHIKTKHDGKQPEGTQKTGGTAQISKRTKLKLEEETIRNMESFFVDFQSEAVSKMGEIARGHVPLSSRIKKEGVSKEIYDHFLQLLKQQSEFKLSQTSSLDLALIVFLVKMGDIVNEKVFEQFLIFARLARSCFYEFGDQIYRALFEKKDEGPLQLKDFNIHYVKYFPIVSDFFIRYYIPEIQSKDRKEANLSLIEVITYDFCKWLYLNKFTNVQVNLNHEVSIDFRPPATAPKPKSTPGKLEAKQKQNSYRMSQQKQNKQDIQQDVSEEESEVEIEQQADREQNQDEIEEL